MKSRLASLCFGGLVWALTLSALPGVASAQAALIVHDGIGFDLSLRTQLTTYLSAAGYEVTLNGGVPSGALTGYAQIWDIRYLTITPISASDATAYTTYLNAGKSLLLVGEHTGLAARNASITSFIAAVGGGTVTASAPVNNFTNTQTVQSPFTGPNAVTTVVWRGAANATGGTGSAITKDSSNTGGATVFPAGKLSNAPTGTLIVVFDSNFLEPTELAPLQALAKNMIAYLAAPVAIATDQTITFAALAGKTFGDAAFAVSATATSSLTVTFTSTTTSVCTVSGTTVTIVAAGTCTIAADQAGNSSFNAAPQVTQSFTVAKASQTITFAALADKTFGDAAFGVSGSSTSSLTVAFSSTTTSICTVSSTAVTIVAAGTCTIAANQAGNGNYSAASQVTRSFTVAKASQTITFAALAGKTFGDAAFTVSGSASSSLTVALSSTTTSVCTVSGTTVTIVAAGTCTIAADQAGNANYNAASQVTQSFTVAKASQTITFAALAGKTFGDAAFTVSGSASSSLTVAFSSTTTSVCTVSSATVTLVAAGTCTIAADQAGNGNYSAASQVTRSFTVASGCSTLSIGPASLPIGAAGQPFSQALSITNGTAPSTFALTSGTLPGGLTLSTAGVLSGTPTTRGAFSITVTGTDANTCQVTQTYPVAISRERQIVIGAGGGTATVRLFNHASAGIVAEFIAQAGSGGVSVASADVNGDGAAEIITGAGPGGSPLVKIFTPAGVELAAFLAYDATVTAGVEVAAGDLDGDGLAEIITAAGAGGPTLIRVFNGRTGTLLRQFDRAALTPSGGMHVGTGDTNGDGRAELLVGAGMFSAPVVEVLDGLTGSVLRQLTVYTTEFLGGVNVAAGDITGDGFADIIVGGGPMGGPHVRVFDGTTGTQIAGPLGSFYAYTPGFAGGVRVAASDLNRDGNADLIVGPGAGGGPHIRVFSGATGAEVDGFFAFDAAFSAGAFVAAAPPMVRMSVDSPLAGIVTGPSIRIAGWAIDEAATTSSGIDAIHAWAYPVGGGAPVFVGAAPPSAIARTDIATHFGGEYLSSNFDFTGTLPTGTYDVVVFARSGRTQQVVNYRIVRITVQ